MAKRNIAVIKNEAEENWRKIVTKTLDEVYGENLVNFSAKGKNSKKRPGIHNRLYKGLYGNYNHLTTLYGSLTAKIHE